MKPQNPGGLDIKGKVRRRSKRALARTRTPSSTSARCRRTPVAKPPKEQPQAAPQPETKTPPKPAPAPPTVAHGSIIQLGAFANQAQAERAWTALSSRFPSIGSMGKLIVPFPGGIRLRATAPSPAEAKQACQALKAAGENCFVAQ